MKIKIYLLVFYLSITSIIFPQSAQQYADIGDFELINKELIKDCKIGFRTYGSLNQEKSNAVMYCSWFGGTSEAIGSLIEKRNFIDTSKYFIVAFDALGNGISSSPSNYNESFPEITIRDMVNSQYKVLTEHLALNHLYAAIGGSMGSMQVFEWAVAYPNFIQKIIPYVSSPKLSSFDLLWMNTQLELIKTSKIYGVSEKEIKIISDMITALFARTPEYLNETINVNEFDTYLASFDKEPSAIFTTDNYVTQLKAMMKHDISRTFNYSMEETAKNIKSELFIIVSNTDLMVNPETSLEIGELTNARMLILENNCGHLAVGCELDRCREEISDFLEK